MLLCICEEALYFNSFLIHVVIPGIQVQLFAVNLITLVLICSDPLMFLCMHRFHTMEQYSIIGLISVEHCVLYVKCTFL